MSDLDSHPNHPSNRYVHEIICDIVEEGSKVLDLGCGGGDLLYLLKERKKVRGTGVEVSEEMVYECIRKGLSVHHGDVDEGLADYPDKSFDYVILSETLQEVRHPLLVFKEMLRVGKKGIISFPNFGYWRVRFQLFFQGKAPVTTTLPYNWYDSPNIHFFTIKDFICFCEHVDFTIVQSFFVKGEKKITFLPNLCAEAALFVIG
jgi:methionine biosynthesis protein MetW